MWIFRALVTGVVAGATLFGLTATTQPKGKQSFGEIDVERINVREPDGTLRFVLSNRASFPGLIARGTEHAHPGRANMAGMLFFNDEGTENGGLIWNGQTRADGRMSSGTSLTFDRYEQDQVIQLLATDSRNAQGQSSRSAALMFNDQPDGAMQFDQMPAINTAPDDATRRRLSQAANIGGGVPRMFVGRSRDGAAAIVMQDAAGRPRIMMSVANDGTASLDFLDDQGRKVRSITPTAE